MVLTYANIVDRVEQALQDTTNATYDATELGYWVEDKLAEFSTYRPHLVDVIFKIESRTGTDVTGTQSSLTDSVESQFLSTDPTNEKVIHNTTDNTFAVVLSRTSASVMVLSADIMNANDNYRIYNKRCTNQRQIYIGDVTDYLWIERVEYPLGNPRNSKVFNEVLEIDVARVEDSDTTNTDLPYVDVLVRFAKPHKLSQLTDWAGELTAGAAADATTIALDGLQTTGTIEEGDEFFLENHRTRYTVTVPATIATNIATLTGFYPGLEAAALENDDIAFVKSTLKPQDERILADMIVAGAILNNNIVYVDAIPKGGTDVWRKMQVIANDRYDRAIAKLQRDTVPRTKRSFTRW